MQAVRSAGPANSPTVNDAQFAVLEEELGKGPSAYGFEDERWTLVRVQTVIRRLRLTLSVASVWRLLKRFGWSSGAGRVGGVQKVEPGGLRAVLGGLELLADEVRQGAGRGGGRGRLRGLGRRRCGLRSTRCHRGRGGGRGRHSDGGARHGGRHGHGGPGDGDLLGVRAYEAGSEMSR